MAQAERPKNIGERIAEHERLTALHRLEGYVGPGIIKRVEEVFDGHYPQKGPGRNSLYRAGERRRVLENKGARWGNGELDIDANLDEWPDEEY